MKTNHADSLWPENAEREGETDFAFSPAEPGRAQALWQSEAGLGWAKYGADGGRERERERDCMKNIVF